MNRAAFLVALLLALLTSGCGAMGEDALRAMSPTEKQFLEQKLARIQKGMSEAQVREILGPAHRNAGTMRPSWLGPEGGVRSQISVYFLGDKAFKVRWMHLGKFTWDRNL